MAFLLDRFQVIHNTQTVFNEISTYSKNVDNPVFFKRVENKWSVAENIQHLISATKMTNWALRMPKFILKMLFGKPNRPSRSFEELIAKYSAKLEAGAVAAGRYIPTEKQLSRSKVEIMSKWDELSAKYLSLIKYYWDEEQLDKYIVPHPMLGKITIRELLYFTLHHSKHHLKIIRQRNREAAEIAA
jgi:hypothetical protein